jgi:type IV pilus assembly protein PilM
MVLDIGASSTKVYIVERGVIAFSHTIQEGGQQVTRTIASSAGITIAKAEELKKKFGFGPDVNHESYERKAIELVFSRIFDEVRRVMTQFETASNRIVSGIVLTGGGGVTPALEEYARTIFPVDVSIANPFAKTEAPAFMRPVLQEIGPEFAVAVGLALRKLEEIE